MAPLRGFVGVGSMTEVFGTLADGTPVLRTVIGGHLLRVAVLTYGAALQSIEVPHEGGWLNVALGLKTLDEYVARSPHFGAVPGRYAGRIGQGRFRLDGTEYRLPQNDGANTLHGGPHGFGKRAWSLTGADADSAELALESADGDAGFPGRVQVRVRYSVTGGSLRIDYAATTDAATVLNLTNHSYFNLAGEGSGTVLGHLLTVDSEAFALIGAESIPTGELRPVAGTALDFRTERSLADGIRSGEEQILLGRGYDHGFVLRGEGMRRAAVLREPASGRWLEVSTDQPSLQVYTGNMLTGALAGPSGRGYRQSDAICLEAQHLADSPNRPEFPSTMLRPGVPFASSTVFRFGEARG